MKSSSVQKRHDECDKALTNPKRLDAVRRTGLIDTPVDRAFDRLAHLAAKLMKAPITIVSIIDDKKQFYKAAHGLPSPLAEIREVPIDGSLCRYTLAGESIVSDDVENFPLLKDHPTVKAFGVKAFVSLPLIDKEGQVLGSFCAVDMQKRAWTDDDMHFLSELTDSVLTEIILRQQVNDLEEEKRIRKSFVSALTHDLRTPLASARLNTEIVKRTSDNEKVNSRLERVVSNIDRADRMIQNLLDADHAEAGGKFVINSASCGLECILKASIEDMTLIWGDRYHLESKGEITGNWDKEALARVFENLLSNAAKYSFEDTLITVNLSMSGNEAIIEIHNRGEVISEKDQSSIFITYHRLDSASHKNAKGWGIGLSLVKAIIDSHTGLVSVRSANNETVFRIALPLYAQLT